MLATLLVTKNSKIVTEELLKELSNALRTRVKLIINSFLDFIFVFLHDFCHGSAPFRCICNANSQERYHQFLKVHIFTDWIVIRIAFRKKMWYNSGLFSFHYWVVFKDTSKIFLWWSCCRKRVKCLIDQFCLEEVLQKITKCYFLKFNERSASLT